MNSPLCLDFIHFMLRSRSEIRVLCLLIDSFLHSYKSFNKSASAVNITKLDGLSQKTMKKSAPDYLTLPSAEYKNAWSCTSNSPLQLHA
jgi:hypothetical protein